MNEHESPDMDVGFLSDEDKELLRRNNRVIVRDNERTEHNANRIRVLEKDVQKLKKKFTPPSPYDIVNRTVRQLTVMDAAEIVAKNGIGRLQKRGRTRKALRNFIMRIFEGA